jgi:hypothetical protein
VGRDVVPDRQLPDAPKARNLRGNRKVALNLDLDAETHSVLTIEGVSELEAAPPGRPAPVSEAETSAYVEKHMESIRWAGSTPEQTFADFSTVIRVTPSRAWLLRKNPRSRATSESRSRS